jgi:hypothetical protein
LKTPPPFDQSKKLQAVVITHRVRQAQSRHISLDIRSGRSDFLGAEVFEMKGLTLPASQTSSCQRPIRPAEASMRFSFAKIQKFKPSLESLEYRYLARWSSQMKV